MHVLLKCLSRLFYFILLHRVILKYLQTLAGIEFRTGTDSTQHKHLKLENEQLQSLNLPTRLKTKHFEKK